jgi:serine/threonine-protein kinase
VIGQLVGTYRILSELGAGGMGTVWLAEHTLLGRRVAIKFLHASVSQNPEMVERFFAEARAATRIADPGIVVVHDFGWHTDRAAYLVMEHLAGESVAARLRSGRFSVVDAVRVVQQAALAMAVAHGSGIIHRDLKPDNLFIVPDPAVSGGDRVKILDFGIAKLVGDDHGQPTRTHTGAIMGTPMYMSPEQCRGSGEVDHHTDIYALGCVLFHLMCGRAPFVAESPGEMIAAHLREPPVPPSALVAEIPAALDAIVLRCLAKDAGDRFATMTELARALGAAVGSHSVVATIPPILATPRSRAAMTPVPRPRTSDPAGHAADAIADRTAVSAPHGAQLSTFASSTGESLGARPRRGRAVGLVLAAAALAAVVVAIVVAASGRPPAHREPRAPIAPAAAAPPDAAPPDAAPLIDAARPPRDARPPAPDASAKRPPRPRTPDYDPFEDR